MHGLGREPASRQECGETAFFLPGASFLSVEIFGALPGRFDENSSSSKETEMLL